MFSTMYHLRLRHCPETETYVGSFSDAQKCSDPKAIPGSGIFYDNDVDDD